jgi:hypothetical protein
MTNGPAKSSLIARPFFKKKESDPSSKKKKKTTRHPAYLDSDHCGGRKIRVLGFFLLKSKNSFPTPF